MTNFGGSADDVTMMICSPFVVLRQQLGVDVPNIRLSFEAMVTESSPVYLARYSIFQQTMAQDSSVILLRCTWWRVGQVGTPERYRG